MGAGRNASIAGIIGWVLFVVAFALAPTPPTLGAAAADIVQYSVAHHGPMLVAAFLFGATAPFLLIWAGALASRLRDAQGQPALPCWGCGCWPFQQ